MNTSPIFDGLKMFSLLRMSTGGLVSRIVATTCFLITIVRGIEVKAGCIPGTEEWQYSTTNVYRCGLPGFDLSTNFYSTEIYEEIATANPSSGGSGVKHYKYKSTWDTNYYDAPPTCIFSGSTLTNYTSDPWPNPDANTCTSDTATEDSDSLQYVAITSTTGPTPGCGGSAYISVSTKLEDGFNNEQIAAEAMRRVVAGQFWINADGPSLCLLGWTPEYDDWYARGQAQLTRYRIKFKTKLNKTYDLKWKLRIDEYDDFSVTNSYVTGIFSEDGIKGTGHEKITDWKDSPTPGFGQKFAAHVIDIDIREVGGGCGTAACGEGDDSTGEGDDSLSSASFNITLGAGNVDGAAGILRMDEEAPSAQLATPSVLRFETNPDVVVVVTNLDGSIHLAAPTMLARIVETNAYSYWIHCSVTNVGAGNFLTNSPFISHLFVNPNGSTNFNTLQHVRYKSGLVSTNEFTCEVNNSTNITWKLVSGNGLKGERLAKIANTNNSTRLDSYSIFTPATSAQLYRRDRLYLDEIHNDFLLSEVIDPGVLSLLTTNTYDAQGRLLLSLNPDGGWERREYDANGWLTRVVRPLTNQPPTASTNDCRVSEYSYASVSGSPDSSSSHEGKPRTVYELIGGQVIGKTMYAYTGYYAYTQVASQPSAGWDDAANEKSYTIEDSESRPTQSNYPDGTYTTYQYTDDASGRLTTIKSYDSAATEFRKTEEQVNTLGRMVSRKTYDSSSSTLIDQELYSDLDDYLRPTKVTYLDASTSVSVKQDCCNAAYAVGRDGVASTNSYDALRRMVSTTRLGITASNLFDASDRTLAQIRQGTNGSFITLRTVGYDAANRVLRETNALGTVTSYFYGLDASNQMVVTITNADGGTRIETRFRDGSVASVTGTAAFPVRYEYGVEADGPDQRAFTREIKLDSAGTDTSEWTKSYTDFFGRSYKTVFAGDTIPYSQTYFNEKGQMWKSRDPDGVLSHHSYNRRGERAYSWIDEGRDDEVDFDGYDRITEVTNFVTTAHSTDVHRTETYQWLTNGSTTRTLVSTVDRSVDGLKSWSITGGAEASTVKSLPSGGSYTVTQTAPDGSYSLTLYQNGRMASVTRFDSGSTQIGKTTYGYDSHGRLTTVADARNGTTTSSFNNADQVVSMTTPSPGTVGSGPQITTSSFDAMGRATNIVQPDSTTVNNVFSKRGELLLTSGSRSYPVGYSYDGQGRMKTMTNWSTFASGAGARVTTWHYDAERGWLTNKVYADSQGTKYSYTGAGRLATRLWARGITTSYSYDDLGNLNQMIYDDGVTPTVNHAYTRRGQLTEVANDTDGWKLFYNINGQLISEVGIAGTLNGLRVTNVFDEYLRRTNVTAANGATLLTTNGYTFDLAGRLSTARDGTFVAAYSYLANSPLVSQIEFKSNTTVRLTTTKTFDNLNRLTSIAAAGTGSTPSVTSYTYSYNDANQRTRVNLADGSFWIYEYDSLGQVKSGKRYWSDWTPVAGQQFEYGFDDIGNRNSTKTGGDSAGGSLRVANYTNNSLNQITGRDVPAYLNVIGAATATATNVNVNNTLAYRKGEYYRVELNPNNASAAIWQSVTNRAVQSGTTNSTTGNLFLPKTAEVFAYDADGNLTNDGRWMLTWDAENRLTKAESQASAPPASKRKLEFTYDWRGMLIRRIEYNGSSGSYVVTNDLKFLNDSLHCIAELNGTNNALIRSYLWGLDLSGTMNGAGSVGGLLAVNSKANGAHFAAFDGNGNVAALINAADGSVSANYEYSPFGERLRATGPMASENVYCFSTKRFDTATDWVHYEYRIYRPREGTWLSRDPIGEIGGKNLYGFVYNNPLKFIDTDGRIVIADDAVIGGVIVAGGIAAWLATPDGQQWLRDTGRNIDQALDYIGDLVKDIVRKCRPKKRCKPCNPLVGTPMFRVDSPSAPGVPGSRPHWIDGVSEPLHTHHSIVTQRPVTAAVEPCKCDLREISVTKGNTPAPREIPQQEPTGGGVTWWPF